MAEWIEHAGEPASNEVRERAAAVEPRAAHVYAQPGGNRAERGLLSLDPEGRRLADFTSGVLVANLGHNPVAGGGACSIIWGWPICRQPANFFGGAADRLQRPDGIGSSPIGALLIRCAVSRGAAGWKGAVGSQRQRSRAESDLGRLPTPRRQRHLAGHPGRFSWQEGVGRRDDRQRDRSGTGSARPLPQLSAGRMLVLERRRQPLDLAPTGPSWTTCGKSSAAGCAPSSPSLTWGAAARFIPSLNICSCCKRFAANMTCVHPRRSAIELRPHGAVVRLHALRTGTGYRGAGQRIGQRRACGRRRRPCRSVRRDALRPGLRYLERLAAGLRRRAGHARRV